MDRLEKSPEELNNTPPEYWTKEENEQILEPWSHEEQKKIIRRVDYRLIPICGLMYCVSLLDRTNLSNAVVAGMGDALRLEFVNGVDRYVCLAFDEFCFSHSARTDLVQSIITLVFFITYTLCQPPATVLCRKIGPRIFLSTITLMWGVVMIGMGFVDKWTSLVGLRVILGILEVSEVKRTCTNSLDADFAPGWILPWSCLSVVYLVHSIRSRQAIRSLLSHWLCGLRIWRNPRLRSDADGRRCRLRWVEVDLHHRRSRECESFT